MRTRLLGRSGLALTEIGYGASPLGNLYREVSDARAAEVLHAVWDSDIRYFDTAPYYGLGLGEQRVGAFLSTRTRTDYVLSTKVGRLLRPGTAAPMRYGFINPLPNDFVYDYSYDGIMTSVEASLARLGIDRIDILLMHDIGRLTHGKDHQRHFSMAMSSGYRAMDELRRAGIVKAIGLGVNEVEVCLEAIDHGFWDCFLLAGRYTLLEQSGQHDLFPQCIRAGTGIIIGGAYNSGILATGTRRGGALYYDYQPAPDKIVRRVHAIEEICDRHDVELPAAAIQFPLAHPAVCTVIPGLGAPERVAQALHYLAAPIPAAFWDDLKAAGLLDIECLTPADAGS